MLLLSTLRGAVSVTRCLITSRRTCALDGFAAHSLDVSAHLAACVENHSNFVYSLPFLLSLIHCVFSIFSINKFLNNIFILESWYMSKLKIGILEHLGCGEDVCV